MVFSQETEGVEDVFAFHLGAPTPIQLTHGAEKEFDPAISPDGQMVAYRRNPQADSDEADIWVMAIDGSDQQNLTNSPEWSNWSPVWTEDGQIAFSSSRGNAEGVLELWIMGSDGENPHRVSEGWCEYPSPSPSGREFVCAMSVGGRYDLVIVDLEGGRRFLTTTPQTEFGPSWSPDGEWISFSRDMSDRWELLRVRPDGSDEQVVAPEGVFSTWGPRGHLVWTGPGGINIANPDGSGGLVLSYPAQFVSWGP